MTLLSLSGFDVDFSAVSIIPAVLPHDYPHTNTQTYKASSPQERKLLSQLIYISWYVAMEKLE